MDPAFLQTVWFVLFGVLIVGYSILDGFDLGVGVLSLFTRDARQRGQHMDVIAPVWDGNEVWLLTGGGALFAAFPPVYATVFSGFYVPLYLLLAALIFRAVSIEFRHKLESSGWRRAWDLAFGLGSLVPAVLYGVVVGNALRGLPIDAQGAYTGRLAGLLNPYALLTGILSLTMFLTHGALYLALKAEGELAGRMARWAPRLWIGWVLLWVAQVSSTLFVSPFLFEGLFASPVFWVFLVTALGAILYVPMACGAGKRAAAFLASSVAIGAQVVLAGVSLYPRLVPSLTDLGYSLTIRNASASPRALSAALVVAAVGMPIVVAYTVFIYRVFKGRVRPGEFYGHGTPTA
jgi:cytochrome d ubiquinol oxidase subunit II